MNDELNGRQVFAPRGRNAEDELANCIVKAAHIFMMGDRLYWIADDQRRPVVRVSP